MGQTNHEQANLLLQLYDLRREARLREARAWFLGQFWAISSEDMLQKYPPGTQGNTNIRMTVSYWDMACGMVNRGLIDDEMFFESNGELWFVWEKVKGIAPGLRTMYKNPIAYKNLEAAATRLEQWWNSFAPGMVEVHRQRLALMRENAAKAASSN
jgi:hypothetical protein